jgi:hypothetical protein
MGSPVSSFRLITYLETDNALCRLQTLQVIGTKIASIVYPFAKLSANSTVPGTPRVAAAAKIAVPRDPGTAEQPRPREFPFKINGSHAIDGFKCEDPGGDS